MAPAGRWTATLAVAAKELRESLRDRQTAIATIVVPICMYPIVFWLMVQGFLVFQGRAERMEVVLAVAGQVPDVELARALDRGAAPAGATEAEPEPDAQAAPDPDAAPLEAAPQVNVVRLDMRPGDVDEATARAWIESEAQDAPDGVLVLPGPDAAADATSVLYLVSTKSSADATRRRVRDRLTGHATLLRTRAAEARGVDPALLEPVEVRRVDVSPTQDKGAVLLSTLLPLLLVVMCVLGAFFPAVDLTAGERERGTAETTWLLPLPRVAVLQGKVLAVATLATLAVFLNLFAMGLSAEHLLRSMKLGQAFEIELPVAALAAVAPLALLFAFSVSAVFTAAAGLARSFKEAQAMLGPVQMVFLLPAMFGMMPGLELTPASAFLPVLNVVLAFKALLIGKPLYLEYGLCALALLLYATLAVRLAVRVLSREALVLSDATIPLQKLLGLLRSEGTTR